jgi:HAD superfamily hydrolase (TIGR01450 family)
MVLKTDVIPTLHAWLQSHLDALDALVFDIDGVLLVNGSAAPGSHEVLSMLRRNRIPFFLLTNDGDHSTEEKADILNAADLRIHHSEIVSCADGLVTLHAEKNFSPAPFFIMGNLGTPCFAQKAGLNTMRDLSRIDLCQGIIVGEKGYDWETTINAVVNFFIQKPDARLIVPNPDEYYPGKSPGHIHIGAGGVARFIVRVLKTYGISVPPIYLGKPYSPIFEKTHARLEAVLGRPVPRCRVLMAGDFIGSDIQGACDFGYCSALLLTGVTTLEMLARSAVIPDLVFETLG